MHAPIGLECLNPKEFFSRLPPDTTQYCEMGLNMLIHYVEIPRQIPPHPPSRGETACHVIKNQIAARAFFTGKIRGRPGSRIEEIII